MSFTLAIQQATGTPREVVLPIGHSLFILGANGSGKSSLVLELYRAHSERARRISAHRQTWFTSNAVSLSAQQKLQTEQNLQARDSQAEARWKDDYSAQRASIAIYELVEAENVRARAIAAAVDNGSIDKAQELSMTEAPIKKINTLLRLSNIPIELSLKENEQVLASKHGGPLYSVAELSDGERNALLMAAAVLSAPKETLLIIDEPERHLHRAIISPLLTALFAERPDCAFVVSTHEILLAADNPAAQTLLVRGCTYSASRATDWDIDLLNSSADLNESIRLDILGARRQILFVEGHEQSLDKPLYALIFPQVSVVPKSSCRDVEHAVVGIRGSDEYHWLDAFGIVDDDRRPAADRSRLEARGVFPLPVYSIESVYYNPAVQREIAKRQARVTGADANACIDRAAAAALRAISQHSERLAERVAEKEIREQILAQLPTRDTVRTGRPINLQVDVRQHVQEERIRLEESIKSRAIGELIARYPIRETPALDAIARELGFQGRSQYEGSVRTWLADDSDAPSIVRRLFGTLPEKLGVPHVREAIGRESA